MHYPAGTSGQRLLSQKQTCTSQGNAMTKCTTTYIYSGRATDRSEKVIATARVRGRLTQIAQGTIKQRTLRLSLHPLAKGRYHVSLLVSRGSRVFVQLGRVWVRVP
jgi:hypothetical protein